MLMTQRMSKLLTWYDPYAPTLSSNWKYMRQLLISPEWLIIILKSPHNQSDLVGLLEGQGINIDVVFLYYSYLGYFLPEMTSVSVVEPKKSECKSTAPSPDQFKPQLLWEKKYCTYHSEISQKKLGCLLILNSPSVRNPLLKRSGSFSNWLPFAFNSLYFSVWKFHCCWSAVTYPVNTSSHRAARPQSQALSYPVQASLIGEENQRMRTSWQQAVKTMLRASTRIQ